MKPVTFCGRTFRVQEVELMREIAQDYAGLGVTEIARTVCELLDWKRPNGGLKNHECRQLLEHLQAEGQLRLPAVRQLGGRGPRRVDVLQRRGEPEPVECAAKECEPLELALVEGAAESRQWREHLERYHYLGCCVPFGAHLRYWVRSRQRELACLLWTSPAWKMKPRDTWIGWSDKQRTHKLQSIVNNGRFLVLPWVRVKGLASKILARSAWQLPHKTGKNTMVTVPCYWRRWWMRIAFEEPAIERPTGSMWARPLGVVGWIGSTRLTVSPSKTFTSIRYSAMQDNGSAPIPPGKSIPSQPS